jgi:hypothetical protein
MRARTYAGQNPEQRIVSKSRRDGGGAFWRRRWLERYASPGMNGLRVGGRIGFRVGGRPAVIGVAGASPGVSVVAEVDVVAVVVSRVKGSKLCDVLVVVVAVGAGAAAVRVAAARASLE